MKIEHLEKSAHFRQVSETAGIRPNRVAPRSFKEELQRKLPRAESVKFSAHAAERLASRNIVLTERDLDRLNQAVIKMAEKGGKESLLVMGDLAFVVSVQNKTIITAMEQQPGSDAKVFTNIDSALIM